MSLGRPFLQLPGPTNVPEEVRAALARPTIDHRGVECTSLVHAILAKLRVVAGTGGEVVIYPSSGSGACEAALVNLLNPGDQIVVAGGGYFVDLWADIAVRLGLIVRRVSNDYRCGVLPERVEELLTDDAGKSIRAVVVIHNETSTGILSRLSDVRKAIDRANHSCFLVVDAISSFGSVVYLHDQWGVDVTVTASQKGLMLPPGLGINIVSDRALVESKAARLPRHFLDWRRQIEANWDGTFPYTPATNMLVALDVALDMLHEEGLQAVADRHVRHSVATRAAVASWGLDVIGADEREHSPTVSVVRLDDGSDEVRSLAKTAFGLTLGGGLGPLMGKVIRIGHLGALSDLELIAVLAGIELALRVTGVDIDDGLQSAMTGLERYVASIRTS